MRTVQITNTRGTETRTVTVIEREGLFYLHDSADTNMDSLEQLPDDSDTSIADAIRDGWEIA